MTSSGPAAPPVAVDAVRTGDWPKFAEALNPGEAAAAALARFEGGRGEIALIGNDTGAVVRVLFGMAEEDGAMAFRGLAARLPPGEYQLSAMPAGLDLGQVHLAWALGAYRFDRYKPGKTKTPAVLTGARGDRNIEAVADACRLARDMVNTPANDMGPAQVEAVAREIASAHAASIEVSIGGALLEAGYPAVHAVGRAADPARAPRMIEMRWGESGPLLALIGKGVVFDSGGLDIKPSASMRQMKKDMGGAAHVLALAKMIMASRLAVRLAVLVPVVENAISGDAMRPGDVLASRKGLSIEVGNTDAEGRLILADALARASELSPDLTLDMATLTGAARVALGPDVVPFYTADEALATELAAASASSEDPLWRMPLWRGYETAIDSDIADVANDAEPWAQAGSVTAALFLQRFAPKGSWVHFDLFAWNPRNRPGWPKGAEAQAIRAIFEVFRARYA